MRTPAVFLDRDGVLNRAIVRDGKPFPPASPAEVEIPGGVAEALGQLKRAGFALVVVTNQPDVARGTQTLVGVEAIHHRLRSELPIDDFRVCPHDDADACDCRKPKPGLLLRPPAYDLPRSVIIGDRWRDIEAGRRAGVGAAILIRAGHDEPCLIAPDFVAQGMEDAAAWIAKWCGTLPTGGRSSG